MADIKLFRITEQRATALEGKSAVVERNLQVLIENNLEILLGIRLIRSEYYTGKVHNGRIDTLGIDEDNTPVIIEYKRRTDENVINQGLFYLDWLLDHKAEFQLRVQEVFDPALAEKIDWSQPRLICIAADFTRYDEHAVQQIERSIDLVRYRIYGESFLLLELANGNWARTQVPILPFSLDEMEAVGKTTSGQPSETSTYSYFEEMLQRSPSELKEFWVLVYQFLLTLGDDVQVKTLKYYIAFRRLRNFVTVEIHPVLKTVILFLKLDPQTFVFEPGFTRDVSNIGHYGTGDVEVTLRNNDDLEKAKPLIMAAYLAE